MKTFASIMLALCWFCSSCSGSPQKDNPISLKETTTSPSASPTPNSEPCRTEQRLNTVAGELKINQIREENSTNPMRFFEVVLNDKVLNKEASYCTMIDKYLGKLNGNDVVLIAHRIRDSGVLADSKNNPIGSDTKYKLITLRRGGSYFLSKSFGNGAPYVGTKLEGEKIIISFRNYFLINDPNRYEIGYEETWIYQGEKLSRVPKKRSRE